ncbi:MAG: ATP-binding cassette domain-containing protein [Acidimicrobiia bacterium]|nr:ATP-binding cassette domain-containing protein [Acidimicrobiia bacterium]
MSEGAPVVSVDGVTVIKDGNRLIQDVDWTIRAGERWILFGANGSGKTTLMEVVSSYLFPARGSVHLFGHRLGKVDVRKLRPRIGYVGPAPTALVRTTFPSIEIVLTGLHASFVDTRWHTYDEADWERARECLRILHADRLSDRQFGTMSEGEKKRVLIARSLMSRPDLLLLDEPGSGLDLGARNDWSTLWRRWRRARSRLRWCSSRTMSKRSHRDSITFSCSQEDGSSRRGGSRRF